MNGVVALVPLRRGSKSIPDKNIKPIGGMPLCEWVLTEAHDADIFSRIVVSTDSEKIAQVVSSLSFPVEVLMRPAELATDTASTESVMLHIAEKIDFEVLATIQATSPLVRSEDFVNAWHQFRQDGLDSLVTGVRVKRFFWTMEGVPLNYNPINRPMRQDFEGTIMENGAFYFTSREILTTTGCRLGGKVGVYEMQEDTAVELDEVSDWITVEHLLLARRQKDLSMILKNIRLLVVDVDGTLTDAGMYYSAEGEMLKKFNTRDAKGLELIRKHGVEVAIMTTEDTQIVEERARKLGIKLCFTGVTDKHSKLNDTCRSLGITTKEVAYIGDDVNDLECIKAVGFSACPADAVPKIRSASLYITTSVGGHGAVREVCERIVEAKG